MVDHMEDEQKIMDELTAEGFDKVWVYDAEPGEVDEEHAHEYDTKLVILTGDIQITTTAGDAIMNTKYLPGQIVEIPRNKQHSAKVGPGGCRYVIAEKH